MFLLFFYSGLTCDAITNGRFVEFSMSMFISKKILKLHIRPRKMAFELAKFAVMEFVFRCSAFRVSGLIINNSNKK